jgi:hypothetical protein
MKRVNKMWGRWVRCCVFVAFTFCSIGPVPRAEEVRPTTPPATGNNFLLSKVEEILKTAMRVIREDEGVVSVSSQREHSLAADTPILFFRKKGSRLEMIARGKMLTETVDTKTKKLIYQIELDKDSVIKYPHEGDYAALLSDPIADGSGDKKENNDFLLPEDESSKRVNDRPGYLEYGLGMMIGSLTTDTNTAANVAKSSSAYRFKNSQFSYYSEYFPIGIERVEHGGSFPTSTYESERVNSSEAISWIGVYYRFRPLLDRKLEFSASFHTLSDRFETANADQNLLTTQVSAMGFGGRARYQWVSPVWKPAKGDFFMRLQSIQIEGMYYPILTASDVGVSRGSGSAGSSGYQVRAGATLLAWIQFIPLFKRWVAQGSVGMRSYSLKFSGDPVQSTALGSETIDPGTRANEREIDFRFFVGIRIDDPIQSLFASDREKAR